MSSKESVKEKNVYTGRNEIGGLSLKIGSNPSFRVRMMRTKNEKNGHYGIRVILPGAKQEHPTALARTRKTIGGKREWERALDMQVPEKQRAKLQSQFASRMEVKPHRDEKREEGGEKNQKIKN